MFIRLFYLLFYIFVLTHCKIEIRDANVAVLSRDEIGMIFYITIQNTNPNSYEVKVNMVECTEVFSNKEKDPNFMYLMGGYMGSIRPHCFKNLTVIYPNMYLHDRRGYCLILIKFKSSSDEFLQKKANISFDTYITKKGAPYIMRGYYNKGELSKCDTYDQDPLNFCKPVNCHMKYLGTRNYYNKKAKKCQKIPLCITDPTKEMPNIIYSPVTNKCRDMEKMVVKSDLETIESGEKVEAVRGQYMSNLNIDCHFGKFNNVTGRCDCMEGWTSTTLEKDRAVPMGLFTYHMCNVEASDWYDTNARKLKIICLIIGILAVLIAMCIILCAFFVELIFNCIRTFEECTEDTKSARTSKSNTSKSDRTSNTRSSRSSKFTTRSKSNKSCCGKKSDSSTEYTNTKTADKSKGNTTTDTKTAKR